MRLVFILMSVAATLAAQDVAPQAAQYVIEPGTKVPLSLINSISTINCSSSIDPMYIDCAKVAGFRIISGADPVTLAPGQSRDPAADDGEVQHLITNLPLGPEMIPGPLRSLAV